MGAGGSGQTPRYPKGLPSGRAERYPLGRRQTQGREWGDNNSISGVEPIETDKILPPSRC